MEPLIIRHGRRTGMYTLPSYGGAYATNQPQPPIVVKGQQAHVNGVLSGSMNTVGEELMRQLWASATPPAARDTPGACGSDQVEEGANAAYFAEAWINGITFDDDPTR